MPLLTSYRPITGPFIPEQPPKPTNVKSQNHWSCISFGLTLLTVLKSSSVAQIYFKTEKQNSWKYSAKHMQYFVVFKLSQSCSPTLNSVHSRQHKNKTLTDQRDLHFQVMPLIYSLTLDKSTRLHCPSHFIRIFNQIIDRKQAGRVPPTHTH